jgi:hypothetical protein
VGLGEVLVGLGDDEVGLGDDVVGVGVRELDVGVGVEDSVGGGVVAGQKVGVGDAPGTRPTTTIVATAEVRPP